MELKKERELNVANRKENQRLTEHNFMKDAEILKLNEKVVDLENELRIAEAATQEAKHSKDGQVGVLQVEIENLKRNAKEMQTSNQQEKVAMMTGKKNFVYSSKCSGSSPGTVGASTPRC
jgi:hypothetical protein